MPFRDPVAALLAEKTTIILDGALATELEARGLDISSPVWSAGALVTHPSLIRDIHFYYYRAGADIAITCSYQATPQGFNEHLGLDEDTSIALIKKSVDLAKQAREDALFNVPPQYARTLLVAGSVGPYGAYLANGSEYTGDYDVSTKAMKDFHRVRIQALVDAGVDLLACETLPKLSEASALLELLSEEFPEAAAWMSFSLRDPGHISDGTPVEDVLKTLNSSPQVVAVGMNCIPTTLLAPALGVWKEHTSKPLVAYPNSGERFDAVTKTWDSKLSETALVADLVIEGRRQGARLVGGCCRTSPTDIENIAAALNTGISGMPQRTYKLPAIVEHNPAK
ncbi:homocysteine methyltransferase [Mytilinidion resinicola]|uniref:Homocysteine methyltransferase n=1 Tax=Mytilinidion resinicola TaxID=574789 RepID=A0A6A6Z162_9PEZI|nr:homocysteine methyltransferase [Mytilinidion resinicola]KAF2814841.1 homocysteine methyltransferase [Mytilinidion resinicola]